MVKYMLDGHYRHAALTHVRMNFSRKMGEMGTFRPGKMIHLLVVIAQIFWRRIRDNTTVLYYPPAGPDRVPFYRDVAILGMTRWMFRKVILHFHAAGMSLLYPRLNRIERFLFRWAYFDPDVGIRISPLSPDDVRFVRAKREVIVPNGIPDAANGLDLSRRENPGRILFVGMLCESKGVFVAIEAMALLAERGYACELTFIGEWQSAEFQRQATDLVAKHGIGKLVRFAGVKQGREKDEIFLRADIFCFPTHFDSESFGLVLVEAMQFALPVVSTNWRGIPSVVDDGKTGFLVPVKDAGLLAERLEYLVANGAVARGMGEAGRRKYLEEYTLDHFHRAMDAVFESVGGKT